jgi:alpha-L-rhamnosidase
VWENLHLGIVYDARRETPGWQLSTYDVSLWIPPRAINIASTGLANATLTTLVHPKIRKTREVRPVSIALRGTKNWVVDLGQNIAGWCRFTFPRQASAGTNISFMHSERLNLDNGTITWAIQPLVVGAYEQTVYIFGNTTNSTAFFEPRFVSYGFRYVQLTGNLLTPPTDEDITCWTVHTDLDAASEISFLPANELIDVEEPAGLDVLAVEHSIEANYNATKLTAEANWISFPTDCPHRERRGWLGDAQTAAETLLFSYDMISANTKWLDDIRDAAVLMYSDGDFPSLAPNYHPQLKSKSRGVDVAWSSAFVLMWDWTWRHAGDLVLAERHFLRAKQYLDLLDSAVDKKMHVLPVNWTKGLLGDWCAALGVNGTGGGSSHFQTLHASGTIDTFYFIRTHEAWLRAHAALNRPESEAAPYRQRVAAARSGFNYAFFNRKTMSYADPTVAANTARYGAEPLQTAVSLALTLGVADLPHVNATAAVQRTLQHDVEATMGGRLTVGLVGSKYILQALSDAGFTDTALGLIHQPVSPSWAYMLDQGPGTLWEQWQGNASWARPRGSLNHIMLGGHASWFGSGLGGIQLPEDGIGWSHFRIAPSLTRMIRGIRVEQVVATGGLVRSSWAWCAGRNATGAGCGCPQSTSPGSTFCFNVSVPCGSTADLIFPRASIIFESGVSVWRGGSFVPGVAGLRAGNASCPTAGSPCVALTAASGDFDFCAVQTQTGEDCS